MTFAQLYRMSRERLLVAGDAALRAHLTEFKDHDLLQTRCSPYLLLSAQLVSTGNVWRTTTVQLPIRRCLLHGYHLLCVRL